MYHLYKRYWTNATTRIHQDTRRIQQNRPPPLTRWDAALDEVEAMPTVVLKKSALCVERFLSPPRPGICLGAMRVGHEGSRAVHVAALTN